MVVTDPRTGGVLALVPRLVMTQTYLLTVSPAKIIPLAERPEYTAGEPRHTGGLSSASTVKPYVAVSALSAGVITAIRRCLTQAGGNCQVRKNVM